MSVIRSNNDTLKKQLAELCSLREAKEQKTKEVNETPRKVVKKDRRNIPGIVIYFQSYRLTKGVGFLTLIVLFHFPGGVIILVFFYSMVLLHTRFAGIFRNTIFQPTEPGQCTTDMSTTCI